MDVRLKEGERWKIANVLSELASHASKAKTGPTVFPDNQLVPLPLQLNMEEEPAPQSVEQTVIFIILIPFYTLYTLCVLPPEYTTDVCSVHIGSHYFFNYLTSFTSN